MSTLTVPRGSDDLARLWWVPLLTGGAWLLLAAIVFRFDWDTVSSISILFGVVMLAAAVTELMNAFASHGWWRLANLLLALAFGVIAIVAFIHPGNTFAALAGVISFYFIFKGAFDVALAFATHGEDEHWWVRLLIGLAEILLGFWAAGYFGRSAILLVVWVGAVAVTRGLTEILLAFAIRAQRA